MMESNNHGKKILKPWAKTKLLSLQLAISILEMLAKQRKDNKCYVFHKDVLGIKNRCGCPTGGCRERDHTLGTWKRWLSSWFKNKWQKFSFNTNFLSTVSPSQVSKPPVPLFTSTLCSQKRDLYLPVPGTLGLKTSYVFVCYIQSITSCAYH